MIETVKDNNELPKNVTNDAVINHTNAEDCNEIQPAVIDENVIEQVVEVRQEDLDELTAKIVQCDDDIRKDNEKENVCLFIQKETVERERDEVVADLQNVER